MKQRVKLAQALVHDPDLLLLDEPTNGLDPAGRDAMLALIHRIGTEFGISVVVCSHLLGEVERICDSLIAIEGGRLLRADRISAMTDGHRRARGRGQRGYGRARRGPDRAGAAGPAATGRLLLVPLDDGRRLRPDPAARWPTSTCRCTASTSAATGWPSSSPRGRPPMS